MTEIEQNKVGLQDGKCPKETDFTSEDFKIQLKNLPKFVSHLQLKNFLKARELKPHKIKVLKSISFVTFMNEEDRQMALKVLQGYVWKNQAIEARETTGKVDPILQKRPQQNSDDSPSEKKSRDNDDPDDLLKDSLIQLWRLSYKPEQLDWKQNYVHDCLAKMRKQIVQAGGMFVREDDLVATDVTTKDGRKLACPCEQIVPSPVTEGYRNKCELSIGVDVHGKTPAIGYRLGKYRTGSLNVHLADNLHIMSDKTLRLVAHMQLFLDEKVATDNGPLHFTKPFDPTDNTGHWRMLLIRETRENDCLLMVDLNPRGLSDGQVDLLQNELKAWFYENEAGRQLQLTSLLVALRVQNSEKLDGSTMRHLHGPNHITELCCGLKFRVSANSFFQVNTLAAEELYEAVKQRAVEMAGAQAKEIVLLDICCGTGTIGLCLARHFKQVIGVELVPEAVEDAKANARLNGVENVEFLAGRAEDRMREVMGRLPAGAKVVAVLDPPRSGLLPPVIAALRQCEALDSVIYVSCDINSALHNFAAFSRAPSKRVGGAPFVPVCARPFDLFPHTNHVEVMIALKRKRFN